MVTTTDRHRCKDAKISPRSKSSRLPVLAQKNENKGVRSLKEGLYSVLSRETKNEKSRKRKPQDAMMKIQQSDDMPDSENEKHRKSKRRHLQSRPDCEVLVETPRVSQV